MQGYENSVNKFMTCFKENHSFEKFVLKSSSISPLEFIEILSEPMEHLVKILKTFQKLLANAKESDLLAKSMIKKICKELSDLMKNSIERENLFSLKRRCQNDVEKAYFLYETDKLPVCNFKLESLFWARVSKSIF